MSTTPELSPISPKGSPPLANYYDTSVPFPDPAQDMSIPARCSCTEYVRIKTNEIMKKETGSLDVLMSMVASVDPANLRSIVDFLRPTSVDNSEDNFEAWAIDKAQFIYSEYVGQNRRTYKLCARFLVVHLLPPRTILFLQCRSRKTRCFKKRVNPRPPLLLARWHRGLPLAKHFVSMDGAPRRRSRA